MSTTIYAVIQSALSRLTVVPSRNIPTGREVERLLNKIFRSSNSVITDHQAIQLQRKSNTFQRVTAAAGLSLVQTQTFRNKKKFESHVLLTKTVNCSVNHKICAAYIWHMWAAPLAGWAGRVCGGPWCGAACMTNSFIKGKTHRNCLKTLISG